MRNDFKIRPRPEFKGGGIATRGTGVALKDGGKPGLWANINARKKAGTSRSKSNSTISPKAYANMKAGFPKKKK
jgi:hypothetical protein